MNFKKENKHMIDMLFVLSLFFVFAFSALMLVIIGAGIYKKTVTNMDENFSNRTSYAYVIEKIRQNDYADNLSVTDFDGCPALVLSQDISDKTYYTYLYEYDGKLMELFARDPNSLSPEAGQAIIGCDSFQITELSNRLTLVELTDLNHEITQLYVAKRANK